MCIFQQHLKGKQFNKCKNFDQSQLLNIFQSYFPVPLTFNIPNIILTQLKATTANDKQQTVEYKICFETFFLQKYFYGVPLGGVQQSNQGILTEGEGSVRLTSSLR
jgi:hypothetical protein